MSHASEILDDVRRRAAPPDEQLHAARTRRDAVLKYAEQFGGVRETYKSGSIAHGTANRVKDADGGVILDRRQHSTLGPDGDDEGPCGVAEDMRKHLRESGLKDEYPGVRFAVQDRSIKVSANQPLIDGCDPSVDLIVALERKGKPGLWIPKNMRKTNPTWDASHPQKHTQLFLPDDLDLRRTRVWATRLVKLWNDNYTRPYLSSFNIAALAYWGLKTVVPIDQALYDLLDYAAKDLEDRRTPDPSRVSDPLKTPVPRADVVARLEKARDRAEEALEARDKDEARKALSRLFPDYVDPPAGDRAGRLATGLRGGGPPKVGGPHGIAAGAAASGRPTKAIRSHGDAPASR